MRDIQKSYLSIFICYISWGLFPIYFKLLTAVAAYELLSIRIIFSFLFMAILVIVLKKKDILKEDFNRLMRNKRMLLFVIAASFLITINWLTYIIAVNTNHILEASFGYYLNPIVTIILAVVFLKERLNKVQIVACIFVACSLIYLFISLGSLPWISLLLAFSFGIYGLCKKKIELSVVASLLIETAIVTPFALIYMFYTGVEGKLTFTTVDLLSITLLVLSGVVTAVPLMLFANAAINIPLYILGILQYMPPTIQFLIGIFVYNEPLNTSRLISFLIIWTAVLIFCYSTLVTLLKRKI